MSSEITKSSADFLSSCFLSSWTEKAAGDCIFGGKVDLQLRAPSSKVEKKSWKLKRLKDNKAK